MRLRLKHLFGLTIVSALVCYCFLLAQSPKIDILVVETDTSKKRIVFEARKTNSGLAWVYSSDPERLTSYRINFRRGDDPKINRGGVGVPSHDRWRLMKDSKLKVVTYWGEKDRSIQIQFGIRDLYGRTQVVTSETFIVTP